MMNFLRGILLRLMFSSHEVTLLRYGLSEFTRSRFAQASMPANRSLADELEADAMYAAGSGRGLFGKN